MNSTHILTVLLLTPLGAYSAENTHSAVLDRQWVAMGAGGKLEYKTTPKGDRIMDFSHAGYMGGGVTIPTVPVKREVAPTGGDDTAAIQAAIAAVSAMPRVEGFRGTVLLQPDVFHCSDSLKIGAAGVVLRGAGMGERGTAIRMTGSPHPCIVIGALHDGNLRAARNVRPIQITDAYVPSGSSQVAVQSVQGFAAGDTVLIRHPITSQWIALMGMDKLVRDGKPQVWLKEGGSMDTERIIREIQGNRITFDAPLSDVLDVEFTGEAGATVVKADSSGRVSHSGLEALAIVSVPPVGDLRVQHNDGIALQGCEDCWVRDVATRDTVTCVSIVSATRITIESVKTDHTRPLEKGAGYPADFLVRGSRVLIHRSSCTGDGSFYYASLGPCDTSTVVLNCDFHGRGALQPHMRWNTGLLLDGCRVDGGRIEFLNRGTSGSGHGWAIGWAVVWNCTAHSYLIQQPPAARNWAIGCRGPIDRKCPTEGFFSHATPVVPTSLYLAQLRERLGEAALKNIGY